MIENISGLHIEGRCFGTGADLDFFKDAKQRICLVYGKNGSGKSTFTKGFSICKSEDDTSSDLVAYLYSGDAKSPTKIVIGEDEKKNIHIFDEEYIARNVKVKEEGLGSIVLLGNQVEIEEQIVKLTEEKKKKTDMRDEINIAQYDDTRSRISPMYYKNLIIRKLREDNSWAAIDSKLKSYKLINSHVTDKVFSDLLDLEVKESLGELQQEFKEKYELFERISNESFIIPGKITMIPEKKGIDKKISTLLRRKIEKPELTPRDQKILDVLLKTNGRRDDIQRTFSDKDIDFCPFCFQNITAEYKEDLLKRIAQMFKQEANEHKKELSEAIIIPYSFNFENYRGIDDDILLTLQTKIKEYARICEECNHLLNDKIRDVFSPVENENVSLESTCEEINSHIKRMNAKIDELMEIKSNNGQKRDNLKNDLISLNNKIYRLRFSSDFEQYKHWDELRSNQTKIDNTLCKEIEDIEKKNNELEIARQSVKIALDLINKSLQYVFFSSERISLELKDKNSYSLKVNGREVSPKNVSSGERNAIALCYFFAEVFKGCSASEAYKQESLYVIDDPISSFDLGNKIGIISYLKSEFSNIMNGNDKNRIVVLSHDLPTIWDIEKATQEINENIKRRSNGNKTFTYTSFEICENRLKDFQSRKRNDSSTLMQRVYKFAINPQPSEQEVIGNAMRRLLETFSSFLYKTKIDTVSIDPVLNNLLAKKKLFYDSFMYRLVLHGESHTCDLTKADSFEGDFWGYVSDKEKQNTAKYLIVLIYLLQKEHVMIHLYSSEKDEPELNDKKEIEANIQGWLKGIPDD